MYFPEHFHPNLPRLFLGGQTQFFSDPHFSLLSVPSPPAMRYWASINRFSSGPRVSSPAGYEEMRERGACVSSNKGNPFRLRSAEDGGAGAGNTVFKEHYLFHSALFQFCPVLCRIVNSDLPHLCDCDQISRKGREKKSDQLLYFKIWWLENLRNIIQMVANLVNFFPCH